MTMFYFNKQTWLHKLNIILQFIFMTLPYDLHSAGLIANNDAWVSFLHTSFCKSVI